MFRATLDSKLTPHRVHPGGVIAKQVRIGVHLQDGTHPKQMRITDPNQIPAPRTIDIYKGPGPHTYPLMAQHTRFIRWHYKSLNMSFNQSAFININTYIQFIKDGGGVIL